MKLRPGIGKHEATQLALVCVRVADVPAVAELLLHQKKDDTMQEAIVLAQVSDVLAHIYALGAFEGLARGQVFHDLFSEMSEQVNALVSGLVDSSLELFPTKFTTRHV